MLAKLAGNLAAMDVRGRLTSYDAGRSQQESFSDRILRMVGMGGSVDDSSEADRQHETKQVWISTSTVVFGCVVALVLAGGLWFQTALMRRRARLRQTEHKPEE